MSRKNTRWTFGVLNPASVSAMLLPIAFIAAAMFQLDAHGQNPAKLTEDLPPGPMRGKATTACTECHEARIIVQQRLSKAAWTKEVDKMTKWGAVVDASDRDAIIDYLSANFNPDQPPYNPPRTASDANGTKKMSRSPVAH
jgi:hypothetical protein